jgi:uncharacterized membrane protein
VSAAGVQHPLRRHEQRAHPRRDRGGAVNPFLVRNALVLLGLSVLAVSLIAGRGRLAHRRVRPMLWNLLLAWSPMLLVMALDLFVVDAADRVDDRLTVAVFVLAVALFVLFLPNSSYLITELGHLREANRGVPPWYDVIAVLSLTTCGVLLCCVSLAYLQLILDRSVVGTTWSWVLVTGCLGLANFGTYLGRYLRFNSWDAITHPGRVLADAGRYVVGGRRVAEALAYTVAFGSFTLCVYLVVALPVLP